MNREIVEQVLVVHRSDMLERFNAIIAGMIRDGWQPVGPAGVMSMPRFDAYQTMARYKTEVKPEMIFAPGVYSAFVLEDDGTWTQPSFRISRPATEREIERALLDGRRKFFVAGLQGDAEAESEAIEDLKLEENSGVDENPYEDGAEHDEYTRADWQQEVSEGNTRLGYGDWVMHQVEADEHDKGKYS